MLSKITSFSGRYRWLSNFWPAEVHFEGLVYPTTENAYQASKTLDKNIRQEFVTMTPGQAKRRGQEIEIHDDWERRKIDIMFSLNLRKFSKADLGKRLAETGDAEIIEGNTWDDTFWGVCEGVGENNLGIILMRLRTIMQEGAASMLSNHDGDW